MALGPVVMTIFIIMSVAVILFMIHMIRNFQRDDREEREGFLEEMRGGNSLFIDLEEPIKIGRSIGAEPVEGNIINYVYSLPSTMFARTIKRVWHINDRFLLRDVQAHPEVGGVVDILLPRTTQGERWLKTANSEIINRLTSELDVANELIDELERDTRTHKIAKSAFQKIEQYRTEIDMLQKKTFTKKGDEGPRIELPEKKREDKGDER